MTARRIAVLGAAAAAVLLVACSVSVTPDPSVLPSTQPASSAPVRASGSTSSPSPVASEVAWPQAGLPYHGDEILDAMRSSRRPGGVADALETPTIAEAVAEAVWTIDGTAWDTIAASGSCATTTSCRLELAGSRGGWLGEDVWIFAVDPATPTVTVDDTTLASVPPTIGDDVDALARSLASLDGLRLTSVRWTPPPHDGRFELSYRDAGEEGGCTVELVLDAIGRQVVDDRRSGC